MIVLHECVVLRVLGAGPDVRTACGTCTEATTGEHAMVGSNDAHNKARTSNVQGKNTNISALNAHPDVTEQMGKATCT